MPNFCKEERLSRKGHITILQKEGKTFTYLPFKIKWTKLNILSQNYVQILPAVSKNNFKKAVDRNYIKRLIRESYRQNKLILSEKILVRDINIAIMFLYTGRKIVSYREIESKIAIILKQIASEI